MLTSPSDKVNTNSIQVYTVLRGLQHMNSPKKEKLLLSVEETAELLGIPAETLNQWRHRGKPAIPYLKVGSLVKYLRSDLEDWLKGQRRTETEK